MKDCVDFENPFQLHTQPEDVQRCRFALLYDTCTINLQTYCPPLFRMVTVVKRSCRAKNEQHTGWHKCVTNALSVPVDVCPEKGQSEAGTSF